MIMKRIIILLAILLTSCKSLPAGEKRFTSDTPSNPLQVTPSQLDQCHSIDGRGLGSEILKDTKFLFSGIDRQGGFHLSVVSMSDGKRTIIADYPTASAGLGFLRDGQRFVIIGHDEMWIGDVNNSPPVKVTINEDILSNFQPFSRIWSDISSVGNPNTSEDATDIYRGRYHSPDNRVIATWSRGDNALSLIDIASGKEKEVVITGNQDTIQGTWTSDGNWFVFAFNHGTYESFSGQLVAVNSSGTEIRELTKSILDTSFTNPALSPDEEKLFFIMSKGTMQHIAILWLDTNKLKLFRPEGYDGSTWFLYGDRMVWSPDGEWIAIRIEKEAYTEDIFIVNVETGEAICIANDPPIRNLIMDWK